MGNYDDDRGSEPKIVIYKDYETPGVWVWEIYNMNEKKCYDGKSDTFQNAYDEAKKVRQKHNRKLKRSE